MKNCKNAPAMTQAEIEAEFKWLIEEGLIERIGPASITAAFDWLLEEGLIEHDGTYRGGQEVYALTAKAYEMGDD